MRHSPQMIVRLARPVVTLLLLPLIGNAAGCSPEKQTRRPDVEPPDLVVLITLDGLRADRVGCYGAERQTTANLDRLAADGLRFTTVGAQSASTLVSLKSMLAAKYPLRIARDTNNATLERLAAVRNTTNYIIATFRTPRAEPLVSDLRNNGYKTAAFTDGGWLSREMGFAVGFSTFDDTGGGLQEILPRVNAWLSRNMTGRRFLFIQSSDVQCPYACREPHNSTYCTDHAGHAEALSRCDPEALAGLGETPDGRRAIADHYDAGVLSADAYVGELLQKLRQWNLYDGALIVVTSGHGESLGAGGRFGHGGMAAEQLLVPLIIKFPANRKPDRSVLSQAVELADVMPTVLEVCGLEKEEVPEGLDGRSLLPIVHSGGAGRRQLIAQMAFQENTLRISNPGKRALLVTGRWLLIDDSQAGSTELFNLTGDQTATADVADDQPERVAKLLEMLLAKESGEPTGAFAEPPPISISEELRSRLADLGFKAD